MFLRKCELSFAASIHIVMHTDRVFAVRRFSNVRPNTMLSIALKMT